MASSPHGGKLVQSTIITDTPEKEKELLEGQKVKISDEARSQTTNISNGVLSPLEGFMGSADYESVIESMRLSNDIPWTIPVLLHVPEDFKGGRGDEITLIEDKSGKPVAQLEFEELFKISKKEYAKKVFGTEDEAHP